MPDCLAPRRLHGLCSKHGTRQARHGSPHALTRLRHEGTPWERFWQKVIVQDGCWGWLGALTDRGYAQFWAGAGQTNVAHKWLWEQLHGSVPSSLELDHLCRTRSCTNPDHLEPVTHAENVRRGEAEGQFAKANRAKTHCPLNHPYAGDNLRINKHGSRCCRTCSRLKRRAYLDRTQPDRKRRGWYLPDHV